MEDIIEKNPNSNSNYQTYYYYLEDFVEELYSRLENTKRNLNSEFDHGVAFGIEECLSLIKLDSESWNLRIENLEKIKSKIL